VWRCFLPDYFCALWIAIPARRNSRYEPIACFPSSCSQGTKIIALGPFPPSGNGDPAMGAKAPVLLLIVNTETSLDALHTYTKCPKLSDVIPSACNWNQTAGSRVKSEGGDGSVCAVGNVNILTRNGDQNSRRIISNLKRRSSSER
jgi:hypothetical protein